MKKGVKFKIIYFKFFQINSFSIAIINGGGQERGLRSGTLAPAVRKH